MNQKTWMAMCSCKVILNGLAGLLVLALWSLPAAAQEDLERPPEIPAIDAPEQPLPPKVQDEQIEPTVTIREEEDQRVEEYRYNGRVYMVKVTPSVGPAYYYVDTDGDGNLETSPDYGLEPVKPIHWKIKEWD
ncbi:DUF2782 domain-containing protein [Elongatibacter sediminis]|uniref:DUF2782 domain-containing protein n=1 Tax=Elongatibacter sediminis TaxID=3119006 RepID=A0AAW9RPR1_9GAMM